jgi:Leucine-rich repeat (LRR) protein
LWNNQLTSLDISKNITLTKLRCWDNQLSSIDLSNCTNLLEFYCGNNQLTHLDISKNTALTHLNCHTNQFMSLDLTNNTNLTFLNCADNQLTSLDVSNNTELGYLYLSNMPTLHEVCVWTMPFPPAGVDIEREGSSNVCFEIDCNGVCQNTEIEEYKKEVLSIFPNPSDDIINIDIENIHGATIEIYNVSGRLIFSKALNSKFEKIDISGLSEGMYFIKVRQEQNVRIEKLIVY